MDTVENLRKVLALNSKINSTLDLDELLGVIMSTAEEVVQAEAASLMLLDESAGELVFKVALGEKGSELKEKFRVKVGEGIAGWVAEKGESLLINDTKTDSRFATRFDNATGFRSKAILCVPMRAKGKMIGILEAINPRGRETFSQQDLSILETFADQAAISVENARLHESLLKQELAERELKIAREIQQSFLPNLAELGLSMDIACYNLPAREVSGDFYDVIKLDEARTGIMIGDVSGKGVPASLYMVRAISDSRFLAPRLPNPSDLLKELNARLVRDSRFGIFTTLFYLIVDGRRCHLEYASAGHHPILRRQSATGEIESLKGESGVPLGLFEEAAFPLNQLPLKTGDAFFLYTDGISEARNKKGEEFTLEGLKRCLRPSASSAKAYVEQVLQNLGEFTKGTEQHDDITFVSFTV